MKIKAVENETHPSMETSKPVGNRGHEEDRGGSWLGAWKPNRREQGRPLHSESVRIIRGIWGQEKAKRQGPPGDTLTLCPFTALPHATLPPGYTQISCM